MHIPKQFEQNDELLLKDLMANYPLATLIVYGVSGLEASHIPLFMAQGKDDCDVLKGHIAKANPMRNMIEDGSSVLDIFQGPQSYVSPNYYPTKKEHGKVVPTWNYAAIHISGQISFIDCAEWKLQMLVELTDQQEAHEASPWKVSDAPAAYVERQFGGIIGIEIRVDSLQGKWKLSQNQPMQNQLGVVDGLSASSKLSANELAQMMKQNL